MHDFIKYCMPDNARQLKEFNRIKYVKFRVIKQLV